MKHIGSFSRSLKCISDVRHGRPGEIEREREREREQKNLDFLFCSHHVNSNVEQWAKVAAAAVAAAAAAGVIS